MRELPFAEAFIDLDTGTYMLRYSLLVSDAAGEQGDLLCESYGVRVSFLDDGRILDHQEAHNVTTDPRVLEALLQLLHKHRVTPLSLPDIIDDFLAS
jgi:hypothetical protein